MAWGKAVPIVATLWTPGQFFAQMSTTQALNEYETQSIDDPNPSIVHSQYQPASLPLWHLLALERPWGSEPARLKTASGLGISEGQGFCERHGNPQTPLSRDAMPLLSCGTHCLMTGLM